MLASTLEIIKTVLSGFLLIGLLIAVFQVRAALRISRANALLRLLEEWNREDLHKAVSYIHSLRLGWKKQEPDIKKWDTLAIQWVKSHSVDTDDEARLEWSQRRLVSQFISRMGYLMIKGYISCDDLFNIIPEAPRLIMVLAPIEKAIAEYFALQEEAIKDWDKPFHKVMFSSVMTKYEVWFHKIGKNRVAAKCQSSPSMRPKAE